MRAKGSGWERVQKLEKGEFKRLVGVTPKTFRRMVRVVREAEGQKKKVGRPSKLSLEEQVLLCMEYLRDYPTYLRLGHNWEIAESNAQRIQHRIEEILIRSGEFGLPGKKHLLSNTHIQVVLVDVEESPIERPKKTSGITIRARSDDIPSKVRS